MGCISICALIDAKKVRYVGLSEVHEKTIRVFHEAMVLRGKAQHFIAIQSEYSLVNRSVYAALYSVCQELNLKFFAYSPITKGLLSERALAIPSSIFQNPKTNYIPQLSAAHQAANLALLGSVKRIAEKVPCSISQLSLAWLLCQENVFPLVSTSNLEHLKENIAGCTVTLSDEILKELDALPLIAGSRAGDIVYGFAPEMRPYSPSFKPE